MDDFNQQKENLFRLIESWTEENIELALEIAKAHPRLLRATRKRYMPIVRLVGGNRLKDLKHFPEYLENNHLSSQAINLEYDEALVDLFKNLPCRVIYSAYSNLEEIPWWVFLIEGLEVLELNWNKITELPEEIGKLKNLQTLQLNYNQLTKLPESIGDLKNLLRLQLDFNQIKEVPESIGNLENLEWLCLEDNAIEALPKSVRKLKNLRWLSIEKTPLGKAHGVHSGRFTSADSYLMKKLTTTESDD